MDKTVAVVGMEREIDVLYFDLEEDVSMVWAILVLCAFIFGYLIGKSEGEHYGF